MLIAKNNKEYLTINDPHPKRDYLYIKDFVNLIALIVNNFPIKTGIYNVGFGKVYSNLEVANILRELIGESSKVRITGEKRQQDILNCSVDIRLIKKTFSWSPNFSLKHTIGSKIGPCF